jgi:hypothetical protein
VFVCEMPSSLSCVCANMNRVHSPKREIENRLYICKSNHLSRSGQVSILLHTRCVWCWTPKILVYLLILIFGSVYITLELDKCVVVTSNFYL